MFSSGVSLGTSQPGAIIVRLFAADTHSRTAAPTSSTVPCSMIRAGSKFPQAEIELPRALTAVPEIYRIINIYNIRSTLWYVI